MSTVGNLDSFLDPGEVDHLHRHLHDHAGRPGQRLGHQHGHGASADGTDSNEDTETVDADQNPELTLGEDGDAADL